MPKNTMHENTYILTGATGAIGKEILKELVARGVGSVVLACRDMAKAEALIASMGRVWTELIPMELDLSSTESVREFARKLSEGEYRIKALINNAGAMPARIAVTPEGHETATQINYISTRLLTELLIPLMESGSSILFTTSMTRKIVREREDWDQRAHSCRKPLRRFLTYGRSKLMITRYARELAAELEEKGIRVNCADPGIVDSAMISMGNKLIDSLSALFFRPFIRTPRQGAVPMIKALDSRATGKIFTYRS